MGRIRTIKPEFPQSESVGRLSREARLLFLLMLTIADDEGRMRGNGRFIAAQLYPYDDDLTSPNCDSATIRRGFDEDSTRIRDQFGDASNLTSEAVDRHAAPPTSRIEIWINELVRESMIARYVVGGNCFIQVLKWDKHQKIDKKSPSKFPSKVAEKKHFDDESTNGSRGLDEDSEKPRRLDLGSKDLGSMDLNKENPLPPSPDGKGEELLGSIDANASRNQNPKPDRPKRDPKFDPIAATASEPWSPDLRSAWASWAAHRREKRSPLTPTMTKGLVDKFTEWGDKRSVAAIRHSIANGWQGLFEPEPGQAKPSEPPPPPRKTRFPEPPPKKGDWYRGHIPWDEVKEYDRECAWNGYWSAKDRWEVQQALAKEKAEEEAEAARIASQKEHQGAA